MGTVNSLQTSGVDHHLTHDRTPLTLAALPIVRESLDDPAILGPIASLSSTLPLDSVYSHDSCAVNELS